MKSLSILIPTRGRPEQLGKCIASLNTMAHTPANIEILLGIDSDCRVEEYPFSEIEIIPIVAERPPGGYENIHHWYNRLYEASVGEYVWIFNDDAQIETPSYDKLVTDVLPDSKILRCDTGSPGMWFPIVHRNIAAEREQFGACRAIDVEYEKMTDYHQHIAITVRHPI